ncbi:MAG: sporulation protein YunB [Oscillospiraceae bacterium]|nr:sporulation protein YunB [Oscillospiraceae bacterium]MCI2036204.1 sporulation protein YunB [Oscillospiraceae bacterium]
MRRRRRYRRPVRGRAFLLLFLFLLILFAVLFDSQIRPVMESVTENEAKIKSVSMINSIVLKEVGDNAVSYENLVNVSRDAEGNVLSITADMVRMNQLKAKIITDVQNQLGSDTDFAVGVPLGTLVGGDLFHGRGPDIHLKLTLSGNVTAEFKSSFESAGINQTRHQIYLDVSAGIYSFLPGFNTTTNVNTNVLVAETVIVGSVPSVVANLK